MTPQPAAFGPGRIVLTVAVAPDGRVEDVRVASSRPIGFSATLFVGRPADEIPALVGRLHSLCGLSHATAAAMAIAAARGDDPTTVVAERFDRLLAERLGEHLRSVFMGPTGTAAPLSGSRETLADLRAVLAAARGLVAEGPAKDGDRETAIDQAGRGLARLGIGLDSRDRLRLTPESWAAEVSRRAGETSGDVHLAADPLVAADDDRVIAALAADPLGFAAAPRLAGRRPETGPFARTVVTVGGGSFDGRGRLEARLGEIAGAAMLLAAPADRRASELARWASAGRLDGHTGHAAVESPRGRLHHLVRVDDDGRVASYAILAPTEWNFAADGPFVATLSANRVGAGGAGRARVERIASAFDPCVGFDVVVEERTDA